MVQSINSAEVHGEVGTGYEGPEKGPFSCQNCEYYRNRSCGQKTMIERSKLPKTENGRVVVAPLGCCSFIERIGDKSKKGHWLAGKR